MKIVDFIASVLHYIEKFPDAQGKEAFVYNEDQDISYPIKSIGIEDGGHLQITTDNDYDAVMLDLRELPDVEQALTNLNDAYAMVMSHVNRKTQEVRFNEDETFEVGEKKPKKLSGLKNIALDLDPNFKDYPQSSSYTYQNSPSGSRKISPDIFKVSAEVLEILEKYKKNPGKVQENYKDE